jgi:hypothetical protein
VKRNRWIIHTAVDYTKEMFIRKYHSGQSIACAPEELPKVTGSFSDISAGWYVLFEGSSEAVFLSDTEPDLHAGDKVKITIERVTT